MCAFFGNSQNKICAIDHLFSVQILSIERMDILKGNIQIFLFVLAIIIIGTTVASPMFYKKKGNDIYEPGEWTR